MGKRAWNVKFLKFNTYTAFYFQIDNKIRAYPPTKQQILLKVITLLSYLFLKFFCFSYDNFKFRFQVSLFYGGRLSFISHHFNERYSFF